MPIGPLTSPVAPTLPVRPVQADAESAQGSRAADDARVQQLQEDSAASVDALNSYTEAPAGPDEFEKLFPHHVETDGEDVEVESTQQAARSLGGIEALEAQQKMNALLLAAPELHDGTDLSGAAGQAVLRRVWPQQSPLQCYLALNEALAQARQSGQGQVATQLQTLMDGLLRSAGPALERSLLALACYAEAGIALPRDDIDLNPSTSALELLRTQRDDGVTLVQVLDILQQQIGARLHKALRTAAAEKSESVARLLGTMRIAQLVVLIRTALDAARDLIAACDYYQTPLCVLNEVLAEYLLELLEEVPGKKHLQSLAEQLLQPKTAKPGLFFTELRHILNQRFALASWRSAGDRTQLLSLLDQLSGLPERPPQARPANPAAPTA